MSDTALSSSTLSALSEKLGSTDFLQQAVERSQMGILLLDPAYVVEFANPAACLMIGREEGQLDGKNVSDLFGEECVALLADPTHQAVGCGAGAFRVNSHCEVKHRTDDGEVRTFRAVFSPLRGGPTGYWLCHLTDLTEFRELQVELHRRNHFFFNLIDSSVDGIIASDMHGRIILFNKGAETILGYSEEEAIATLHVSKLYPEGEARKILERMRSANYGGRGKLRRHELIAITKDGYHVPMSLSGGILYDGEEEIATFGIFTDRRAMQKIESDLQQTHKMLVQSEKMAGLGRLAAGVAHEINNPMSGIMLYSALVLEQLGEDHPAAADLEVVIREADQCKQIVSDLLEFSHQTSYEQTGVDVNEQVRKTLSILQKQPLFHNIKVVTNLAKDLSRISGNAIRLNQVFTNIIVNAAQAMSGHGILTIMTQHRSSGGMVEIRISDSGPGIPKRVLSRIFDPFFTTKADDGGTGLGLSVSYAIVLEHRGQIRVESAAGEGATFFLRFPAFTVELSEEES